MCRSLSEGGRRCKCTRDQMSRVYERRMETREFRRTAVRALRSEIGPVAARSLMELSPNKLYVYSQLMEDVSPGISEKILGDSSVFPGIHNSVIEDTRDRKSDLGKELNAKKLDHFFVAKASLAASQSKLNILMKQGREKNADEIAQLEAQIASHGLFLQDNDDPFNKQVTNRALTEEEKQKEKIYRKFLEEHDERALVHVYDNQLAINSKLWDQAFANAEVSTSPRELSPWLKNRYPDADVYRKATLADVARKDMAVQLAEGVIATRTADGVRITADGVTVNAPVTASLAETLARIPTVDEVKVPSDLKNKADSNQWKGVLKHLLTDADEGKVSTESIKRELLYRMMHSQMKVSEDAMGPRKYRRAHSVTDLIDASKRPRKSAYKNVQTPIPIGDILVHKRTLREAASNELAKFGPKERELVRKGRLKYSDSSQFRAGRESNTVAYLEVRPLAHKVLSTRLVEIPPYLPSKVAAARKNKTLSDKSGRGVQAHLFDLKSTVESARAGLDDPQSVLRKHQLENEFRTLRAQIMEGKAPKTLGTCYKSVAVKSPEQAENLIKTVYAPGRVVATNGYILGAPRRGGSAPGATPRITLKYVSRERLYQKGTVALPDRARYVVSNVEKSGKNYTVTLLSENEM